MSQYYPSQDNEPQSQPDGHRPENNPYMGAQEQGQAPDPNAGAATLSNADMRRMNRKALLFLGGIVFLLLLMAFWLMHSLSNRNPTAKKEEQPKVEELQTPDSTPGMIDSRSATATANTVSGPPLDVVADRADPQSRELLPAPEPSLPPPRHDPYVGAQEPAAPPAPREPTLMERRMANAAAGSSTQAQPAAPASPYAGLLPEGMQIGPNGQLMPPPATANQEQMASARIGRAQRLSNPDALLLRGTYVRCVLETRIVTDIPGFTSCVVAEPVYSVNGRRLLVDRGSKLVGAYQMDSIQRGRVGVVWDRITTPTGYDISMASPGVDNLGGAGHVGQYDAHWPSRIASAVMISLIADAFKYAGAKNGPPSTIYTQGGNVIDQPYQSETANAVRDIARQAVENSANRKPTVTINQGTVVNVYINKDIDFSSVLGAR